MYDPDQLYTKKKTRLRANSFACCPCKFLTNSTPRKKQDYEQTVLHVAHVSSSPALHQEKHKTTSKQFCMLPMYDPHQPYTKNETRLWASSDVWHSPYEQRNRRDWSRGPLNSNTKTFTSNQQNIEWRMLSGVSRRNLHATRTHRVPFCCAKGCKCPKFVQMWWAQATLQKHASAHLKKLAFFYTTHAHKPVE